MTTTTTTVTTTMATIMSVPTTTTTTTTTTTAAGKATALVDVAIFCFSLKHKIPKALKTMAAASPLEVEAPMPTIKKSKIGFSIAHCFDLTRPKVNFTQHQNLKSRILEDESR